MNTSIIRYVLGQVLKVEGLLMLLPCLVALIYQEKSGFAFLISAFLCIVIGFLMTFKKPKNNVYYLKEGCVSTALSWIALSIFGALPFYISKEIPSYTNALFETISGFTTTGSSILENVDALSHCILFWRSFTHWIGGMGVLVFVLAVIPLSGGSNINILRAESPGPSVGKLVPKMRVTTRILYAIYMVVTLVEIVLLVLGKMPLFDAICASLGTAGTGGFAWSSGLIDNSPYIIWVITIFMILFGVNFNAYYFILLKQVGKAFSMEEVRAYFLIIAGSVAIITCNIANMFETVFEALAHAAFQVGSIITTTGYASYDFNLWPSASKVILVVLMFIGACAGSTGGGIKVSRIMIWAKAIRKELRRYIHPHSVQIVQMDKKPLEHEVVRSVNTYMALYFLLFVASCFLISLNGYDLVTTFTATATSINNIGPGLGELIGPVGNFSCFNAFSKYVLMFNMLAGRLELFPLIIMFHPTVWIDFFKKHK